VAYDLLIPLNYCFTPDDTLDIVMKAFSEMGIDEFPVVDKKIVKSSSDMYQKMM